MPGSQTTQSRSCARDDAQPHVAFRALDGVGAPIDPFAARWLACQLPCRRFAPDLTAGDARRGADAGR